MININDIVICHQTNILLVKIVLSTFLVKKNYNENIKAKNLIGKTFESKPIDKIKYFTTKIKF